MAAGDEILAMIKEVKEQQPIERTACPDCGWTIEKHPNGTLHCPYCGWRNKKGR